MFQVGDKVILSKHQPLSTGIIKEIYGNVARIMHTDKNMTLPRFYDMRDLLKFNKHNVKMLYSPNRCDDV